MTELFKGLKQIEKAREQIRGASFMSGLYLGKPDFELLLPAPETAEDKAEGEAYCRKIETFLKEHVDAQKIESSGKITKIVLKGLLDLGAFGMKIPKQYGGLGFSHKNYGRVLTLIASWSNILSLTVAVPQSIGIAMPILLFGNQQQKDYYLPLVARKEISAFALTEPDTGSDAANVKTEAVLTEQGDEFVVNGEKLWCTNGAIARYITLIAKVPARQENLKGAEVWLPVAGSEKPDALVHTAFILDMKSDGVEVKQRCQFAGCRGIANAHMSFSNVRIPKKNIIGEVGAGLRYALSILNIGRAVSVPAICLGMAKQAWQPTLDRLRSRVTFGEPLANRQTQRIRVGQMATNLFVMEALCEQVWQLADQKNYDVRIEAAVTKIFCSEQTIQILNDAQIIFGGMGYETAESKQTRGEPGFELEQLVRDATMYRIGEGATDILRPFVAREALNFHLQRGKEVLEQGLTGKRLLELLRFYTPWYASLWVPRALPDHGIIQQRRVQRMLSRVETGSRALARVTMYAMLICRQNMQQDQGRQNRIEMVGETLFAMAACALYAQKLNTSAGWLLADEYFRTEKVRLKRLLRQMLSNDDRLRESVGEQALGTGFDELNRGVVKRGLKQYLKNESSNNG